MDASLKRQPTHLFEGFTLAIGSGVLFGPDGAEVELRPKSLELLHHLVLNAGQVVTREALLDAVWPSVTVSDESVTQCVRDIRRALGDDAQRLVRTVPKRGYMLTAEVVEVAANASERPALPTAPPPERTPFAIPARTQRLPIRTAMWVSGTAVTVLAVGVAIGGLIRPEAPRALPPVPAAAHAGSTGREEAIRLAGEGMAQFEQGAGPAVWLRARKLFHRAVEADPTLPDAWSGLALTYTSMVSHRHSVDRAQDLSRAEQAAGRAVALAPQSANAHVALGSVLRQDPDRLEEALVAYRRAVELSSTTHPARANVGWLLVLLGRAEEGEAYLRATLAAAPQRHPLRRGWEFYLGVAELLRERDERGLTALSRVMGRPVVGLDSARTTLLFAAALVRNGRIEEAAQFVREVRERTPELTLARLRVEPFWLSRHSTFLAQQEKVLEALALAGML